jgi:hypothetical protein
VSGAFAGSSQVQEAPVSYSRFVSIGSKVQRPAFSAERSSSRLACLAEFVDTLE